MSLTDYDLITRLVPEPLAGAERARDGAGREVRIRLFRGGDHAARREFKELAEAWRGLAHAAVVPVSEIGDEGEAPYLVEELPAGRGLAGVVARSDLGLDARVRLLQQIAACLAYTHHRGVEHQSLTVAEVTVKLDGTPGIAGFGVGRLLTAAAVNRSLEGARAEVLAACPPEQILGGGSPLAGDVYAFGVLAYHVLVGEPLFATQSVESLLASKMGEESVDLAGACRSCPRDLVQLVEACLARDPGKRPIDFGAVREILDRTLPALRPESVKRDGAQSAADAPPAAPTDPPSTVSPRANSDPQAPSGQAPPAGRGRGTRTLVVSSLVILVAIVAAVFFARGQLPVDRGLAPTAQVEVAAAPALEIVPYGGVLVIEARPWGEIVAVVGADGRELPLPSLRFTPATLEVAPGEYEVSVRRPDRVEAAICTVRVESDETADCVVDFFSVNSQQYFREAGWWR